MEGISRTNKDFTPEERARLLEQFKASGLGYQEFAREHNVNQQTMKNWVAWGRRPAGAIKLYSPTERKKILEIYLSSEMSKTDFCKVWGISSTTLLTWEKRYEERGSDGLMNAKPRSDDKRVGPKVPAQVRAEIVDLKKKEPSFGIKKISQWLFRFRGVKVSPGSVRKAVVGEGLPLARPKKKRKKSSDRIRRFERARPMQLWQSDITQLTLGQYWSRVYLTVFMDDHSRYIVGWRLQSRQTADLVIDAFKDACTRFGKPEEVLTDQGRQYFAWRGKSELEKLLEKDGIKHVVSRAHHPQTLGKCERFWETVQNEFWTRVKPQDLEEARVRIKYFIDHYNHQRPHQGLNGQVPADRFFGVAEGVREAIEKTIEQNALKMAVGELPKPPAFLIGQVGNQRIAFHGTSGKFILHHEEVSEQSSAGPDGLPKQELENRVLDRQDVFEPSNGDKDGRTNKGQSECQNAQSAAPAQDTGTVSSDTNQGLVVIGHAGGERAGEKFGSGNNGVLDGAFDEEGSSGKISSEADSTLAAEKPGGIRNDGWTIDPAATERGGIYE